MVDSNVNMYPSRSHNVSGSSVPGRNSSLLVHSASNSVDQSQDSGCFDNLALIKSATNEEVEEEVDGDCIALNLGSNQPPLSILYPVQWVDGSGNEQQLLYDPNFNNYYSPSQQLLYTHGVPHTRFVQIPNAETQQMQYCPQVAAGPPTQFISSDGHIITVKVFFAINCYLKQKKILFSPKWRFINNNCCFVSIFKILFN